MVCLNYTGAQEVSHCVFTSTFSLGQSAVHLGTSGRLLKAAW